MAALADSWATLESLPVKAANKLSKKRDAPASHFKDPDRHQPTGFDSAVWVGRAEHEAGLASAGKAGQNRFGTVTSKGFNSEKPVHPGWRK